MVSSREWIVAVARLRLLSPRLPGRARGLFAYTGLNVAIWAVRKTIKVTPANYGAKEYWTYKPAGETPWIARVVVQVWNRVGRTKYPLQGADDIGSRRLDPLILQDDKNAPRSRSPEPMRTMP